MVMRPIRDLLKVRRAIRAARNTKEKIMAQRLRLGKGLLRSKTFWVNLLTGAASVMGAVGGISVLPTPIAPYLVGGLAIVNIFLRLLTNKPISGVK